MEFETYDIELIEQDDEGVFTIGCVRVLNGLPEDTAHDLIRTEWEPFQATEPNTDSEFVGFLAAKYPDIFGEGQMLSSLIVNN